MHSVLVLGCGSIGERHLRCFQSTGRARVAACETNPELRRAMAERYGVRTADDFAAALQEPFNAIIICTRKSTASPACRSNWRLPVRSETPPVVTTIRS